MVLTCFVTGPKRNHLLYNKVISVLKKTEIILKLPHHPSTYKIP